MLGSLLVVTLVLYRETVAAIVGIWIRSDAFTHGFLVLPIVLWMIWRRREKLVTFVPVPSAWGVALLTGAAFTWSLGYLAAVNVLMQFSLIAIIISMVPALLGVAVARSIAFPLFFLFFAVPFGEFAMPQLMEWTANFTVWALRLSGVPVFREGLHFVIPSGSWSVVEACSGVRYLIASLTVGTLFSYLNYQSTTRRVLFVIVSFLIPIIANWFRAYMIVMIGHLSGNTLAVGVDHLIYGWAFFGLVVMIMFAVGAKWSEPEIISHREEIIKNEAPAVSKVSYLFVASALIGVLAMPLVMRYAVAQSENGMAAVQLTAPRFLAHEWSLVPNEVPHWKPAFANPSAQINTYYVKGGDKVGLYIGYYQKQEFSRKLVSSENVLVRPNDSQWSQVSQGSRIVDWSGNEVLVRTGELRSVPAPSLPELDHLVIWKIYWVNGKLTASDVMAKAYAVKYRLLGQGDDSVAIVLYAPNGEKSEGDAALTAFVRENAVAIDALLRKARSGTALEGGG